MEVTQEPELSGVHNTAVGAAALRALHLLRDGEPKILRDEYALALTGWTEEQAFDAARTGRLSASSATWVCRSRFAEDRLALARAGGVDQYVLLGAGLDSFALRHGESLGDLVVYEVDDPPMQEWKRWRMERLDMSPPAGLRFVPCDFEARSVREALADAKFNVGAPAFVSWLGVTQYLTGEAIAETLRWVAGLHSGSEIVFTYVVPSSEAEATKAHFARRGTRFETFFTPEEIMGLVTEAGLHVELFTPDQMEALYFQDRDDGLHASSGERLIVGRTV